MACTAHGGTHQDQRVGQNGYIVPRPHPSLVTGRVLVMQRLSGFKFDDVVGMHDAGIDTVKIIRTGMIAFMEGAMIHGIFHGSLAKNWLTKYSASSRR